jgi:hypothetical protein
MLRLGALILVAAIVASALIPIQAFAASQPPAPTSSTKSGPEQEPPGTGDADTHNDDRGTEKRPFIVETHTAPESQTEAEKDASYQQQRTAAQDVREIGIATIVVGAMQTVALVITFFVIAYIAVSQLRAYVYPGTTAVKKFTFKEPVLITIEMKNVGQTPARKFECHGNAFVMKFPIDKNQKMPAPKEDPFGYHSVGTIYPKEFHSVEFDCMDLLEPGLVKELKRPKPNAAIYVAGGISYRDIFGFKRETKFCRFIHPEDTAWLIDLEQGAAKHDPARIIRFTTASILNDFE